MKKALILLLVLVVVVGVGGGLLKLPAVQDVVLALNDSSKLIF